MLLAVTHRPFRDLGCSIRIAVLRRSPKLRVADSHMVRSLAAPGEPRPAAAKLGSAAAPARAAREDRWTLLSKRQNQDQVPAKIAAGCALGAPRWGNRGHRPALCGRIARNRRDRCRM